MKQCPHCVRDSTPQKEPLMLTALPDYPWQKIGTDLLMLDEATYLIAVDYFSRYPKAVKLTTVTSQSVIKSLKSIFSKYGIPEEIMSDATKINSMRHRNSQTLLDHTISYIPPVALISRRAMDMSNVPLRR